METCLVKIDWHILQLVVFILQLLKKFMFTLFSSYFYYTKKIIDIFHIAC